MLISTVYTSIIYDGSYIYIICKNENMRFLKLYCKTKIIFSAITNNEMLSIYCALCY